MAFALLFLFHNCCPSDSLRSRKAYLSGSSRQARGFYGTAEAVPFVKSLFPICLKALTNPAIYGCRALRSIVFPRLISGGFRCCPNWPTAVTPSRLYMSIDVGPETALNVCGQIRDSF